MRVWAFTEPGRTHCRPQSVSDLCRPCSTLDLPACPSTPQATARRCTRSPEVRAALRWRRTGEAAADQLHCASGVARRDVTRNASPSSEAGGSLALRTGRDNKHCDAAKFSSDSSADSFPRGPFRRPFCCALAPHNVALSSPLKTALARRLPKPPRAPQPPRQARFAPAGPRPRAPLDQKECRRKRGRPAVRNEKHRRPGAEQRRDNQETRQVIHRLNRQTLKRKFAAHSRKRYDRSIAAWLPDSRCVFKSGSPVLVLSPVTGPLPHHGAKQRGSL